MEPCSSVILNLTLKLSAPDTVLQFLPLVPMMARAVQKQVERRWRGIESTLQDTPVLSIIQHPRGMLRMPVTIVHDQARVVDGPHIAQAALGHDKHVGDNHGLQRLNQLSAQDKASTWVSLDDL